MATKQSSIVSQDASSGSLTLLVHPLVIINISDHWTRSKVQNNLENPRVIGALMGLQTGRQVEISNSFELVYDVVDHNVVIEQKYLVQKQEQFRKVFPTLDFLGWYSTGSSVQTSDMEVHKQFFGINESPLFLLLDPIACARPDTKDLPIHIFESELKMVNEQPSLVFVKTNYKIETNEAERIAVDHVAKITPTGSGATGSQLSAHLTGIHGSLSMLNVRIKILLKFLEGVKSGKIPKDHGVMRAVGQLCNQLPQADTPEFRRDFISEYNDVLMIAYLASITKGTANINDLIDKFNVIYDRQVRRRGLY